jgi:hypothetical protein
MLHLQAGIIYFLSGSVPSGSVQSGLQTNFITKFKKSLNKIVSSKYTNKTTDWVLKTNNQTNPHPGSENSPDPKKIITDPQHSKRASYFHTNPHPGSEKCPDQKKIITDPQHSKRASYFHRNPHPGSENSPDTKKS